MAVGSLTEECAFVEWISGLNVQDLKPGKEKMMDHSCADSEQNLCLVSFKTYSFFLFLCQTLAAGWVIVCLSPSWHRLEGILPCEHRDTAKTSHMTNFNYCSEYKKNMWSSDLTWISWLLKNFPGEHRTRCTIDAPVWVQVYASSVMSSSESNQ